MKQIGKELINGKYFFLFAIIVLSFLKLLSEYFQISIKDIFSVPAFKISILIFFGAALFHFILSLLIIFAVTRSEEDNYEIWYARNSSKKVYRIINAFINLAYISLAILSYGMAIYLTLSISWLNFSVLVMIWLLRKAVTYFTRRNRPVSEEAG